MFLTPFVPKVMGLYNGKLLAFVPKVMGPQKWGKKSKNSVLKNGGLKKKNRKPFVGLRNSCYQG